ncbi:RusA family crossover junction endodeoxyribonuclease [Paenibacillus xylanexedens]|uniref:RusA family crossover junction endodeoxyribonuclease n=1 Tax=Paenibacillus xylanexedens TaxID=528191 RepID=UPI0011A85E02|nr:RusA family crossover junction endodeoxyribonuclease [Paenibacillus xylanexedens]
MIEFTVDIAPMGAVRMTQKGKWTSESAQRYMSYKRHIGLLARAYCSEPLRRPVHAEIHFYYPIPSSWSKKRQEAARVGQTMPVVKPDIDNCVKGIFDSLNKIAWNDDNQVVSLLTQKFYSDKPRIEIRLREVEAA